MAHKKTTAYQWLLQWLLLLSPFKSFFFQISYIDCFHSTLLLGLNMGFVRQKITKVADKMVPAYQFALVVLCYSHLLHDCFQISYMDYFYQTLAQVRIYAWYDNKYSRQNDHHLSVCTSGNSNLVIYHTISFISHIWTTFFKLLFVSEYGFCPMNDIQECCQNGYPFSLHDIIRVLFQTRTVLFVADLLFLK